MGLQCVLSVIKGVGEQWHWNCVISVIEEGVASLSGSCKMMFTMKLDPKDWDEINISRDVAGTILVKRRRGEG